MNRAGFIPNGGNLLSIDLMCRRFHFDYVEELEFDLGKKYEIVAKPKVGIIIHWRKGDSPVPNMGNFGMRFE